MSEENLPEVPVAEEAKEEAAPVVEPAKEVGIKETQEFFNALSILAQAGVKVFKDKRVNGNDAFILLDLFKQTDVLAEGFKGLPQIKEEIKNLSKEELVVLVLDVFKHVEDAREAAK